MTSSAPETGRARMRRWGISAAIEAVPVVVVVFLGIAVLGRLVQTPWVEYLFYNADSIALPLLELSAANGEPFEWVFSAQNFFFPESFFYAVSSVFTTEPRVALSINACLNLVVFYALLRGISHQLAHHTRHRFLEIAIALGVTILYGVMILLEATASPNQDGIVALLVLTTWNSGVVLGGFALVLLTLWVTRSFSVLPITRSRTIWYLVLSALLVGLTGFSNFLFVMEVVAPYLLVLLLLVFMNRISWRQAAIPGGGVLAGLVIVVLLRTIFAGVFGNDPTNYLSYHLIPNSIENLYSTLLLTLGGAPGILKVAIVAVPAIATLVVAIVVFYRHARPELAARTPVVVDFLAGFVTIACVAILAGQVITGSTSSRYLQPLFAFPMISLVAIGVYALRRLLLGVERAELRRNLGRFALGIAALASALIIVAGSMAIPAVSAATDPNGYTGADCLDEYLGDADANGVSTFWSARPLSLYGHQNGVLLQVESDLRIHPWMVNLAAYDQESFSYVVADGSGILTRDGIVGLLGEPSDERDCGIYQVYDYAGSRGEATLTSIVLGSLAEQRAAH